MIVPLGEGGVIIPPGEGGGVILPPGEGGVIVPPGGGGWGDRTPASREPPLYLHNPPIISEGLAYCWTWCCGGQDKMTSNLTQSICTLYMYRCLLKNACIIKMIVLLIGIGLKCPVIKLMHSYT